MVVWWGPGHNAVHTDAVEHNVAPTVCCGTDWLGWTSAKLLEGGDRDASKRTEELSTQLV